MAIKKEAGKCHREQHDAALLLISHLAFIKFDFIIVVAVGMLLLLVVMLLLLLIVATAHG